MSASSKPPRRATPVSASRRKRSKSASKSELAALSALLGVMYASARLSEELLELTDGVMGHSIDALMKRAGISIDELEDHPAKRLVVKGEGRKLWSPQRKRA